MSRNTQSSNKRRQFIKTIGAGSVIGLAGCAGGDGGDGNNGGSTGGGSTDPLQIGLTRSTQGNAVADSEDAFRALQVWRDDVNQQGGVEVDGEQREVELVYYDDRSSTERVTQLYGQLINEDNVDALIAPFSSTLTSAAAAVADREGEFMVTWGAADPNIFDQGYENLISVEVLSSELQTGQLEMMGEVGIESISLLYRDEAFHTSMADATEEIVSDLGIEILDKEGIPSETTDYTTALNQIESSDPDVFFPILYVGELVNIFNQMRNNGISFDWVNTVYAGWPDFHDGLGETGEYATGIHNIHPEMERSVTAGMNLEEFFEQFRSMHDGTDPGVNSGNGYAAGVVLQNCFSTAGSTEAGALRSAAQELSGNLETITGPFEIHEEKGYRTSTHYVVSQNQDMSGETLFDRIEIVGPESLVEPSAELVYPAPDWNER